MEKEDLTFLKILLTISFLLCLLTLFIAVTHTDNNSEKIIMTTVNIVTPAEKIEKSNNKTTIRLYDKNSDEKLSLNVDNLLPGDSCTKLYTVQVSFKNKITVHNKITVKQGYEKLAEVLKIKIKIDDEVVYDDLISKAFESGITYSSSESTIKEIQYEITTYLDTSVGNEYQNKDLVADFEWWVEEPENLKSVPNTGVFSNLTSNNNKIIPVFATGVLTGFIISHFFCKKKKEENEDDTK